MAAQGALPARVERAKADIAGVALGVGELRSRVESKMSQIESKIREVPSKVRQVD
jgi:hypothetical protein